MPKSLSHFTRRSLAFDDLDAAVREAETLLQTGYERAGDWSLGQVCRHLAQWMRFPLDGFPTSNFVQRVLMGLLRHTIGKRQLAKVLDSGKMPAGGPTLRATVPESDTDDVAALAEFRESVARFKAHTGPLHPSPLFGTLDKATATQLQLVHCAHHLSFLIPRNDDLPTQFQPSS